VPKCTAQTTLSILIHQVAIDLIQCAE